MYFFYILKQLSNNFKKNVRKTGYWPKLDAM